MNTPNAEKVYEATVNVHVPSLKCSYLAGTRFLVKDNMVIAGFNETPLSHDFKLLVRNGILRELSADETSTPEQITQPKVIRVPERKKMKVEILDEPQTTIVKKVGTNRAPAATVTPITETPEAERTVRGMKVVTTQTTDISPKQAAATETNATQTKPLTTKPNVSSEKLQEVEARKQARLEALAKARQSWSEKAAKARQEKSKA